ncbi:hypothetical protein INT23_18400 [Salmonella enterica subsp. enterica serovar Enteritidis]|uniref:FAD-binding oxidoreductase n=1 Tax=Salmonella enterica TaxID=28901 RepID=UPI001C9A3541|nr:FAD-binding oxidoreductase [Salmonella enterica]MBY7140639.1 hypothetical protein [Salmonella enterica subsp. enterica serovar Enteritidis]
MADWVTGKVTKVQNWTDALFSLTVHAPINPFTAGQFTKLGLEIDGERVQRAYSYVNAPDNPNLEFYLVTVPQGKLSPRLAALIENGELEKAVGLPMDKETSHVMLCGNPQMVRDTQQLLKETRQMTKHLRRRPGHMTAEHYW